MAKNNKHWVKMMSSDSDRKVAKAGQDPLEVGLSDMSWFQRQTRKVKHTIEKTRETFVRKSEIPSLRVFLPYISCS